MNMTIPVYAVTGFLEAGKTSFLTTLLNRKDWKETNILLLQFESGEEAFVSRNGNCDVLTVSKKQLERQPDRIIQSISDFVNQRAENLDEIWVEWNGVEPFATLQSLFLHESLRGLCSIQRVIHVADGEHIENLLGRTGGALPEQIANSDFAILRGTASPSKNKRVKRLLKGISPDIEVFQTHAYSDLYRKLFSKRERPVTFFFMVITLLLILYLLSRPLLDAFALPMNQLTIVFLGLLLQALPFLLIGVLLSAVIQIFVPDRFFNRWFPKSFWAGMLVAIIGGFCLPVCDCASIPIFRSLVKKGVPLPAAVTFMTAAPVINPVVILSTYYAFGGDLSIVLSRIGLGIFSAVIIGLVFAYDSPKEAVLSGGAFDRLLCRCGCYEDVESMTTISDKLSLFVRHSQAEFFSVGKYLVIGCFVASLFQILGTGAIAAAQSATGLAVSIILMMGLAFGLSLCSSSDAVIARSFANQFPMGAIMGFLVFGPMMDIKNIFMLSAGFTKRFIVRLLLASFAVCFVIVFLFSSLGGV
jgi:uncharacterized membrane protein YraQ (UPF0718 family)